MAFRTAGVFTLAATNKPQPMFGSWITAGIAGPTQNPTVITLGGATGAGNDAGYIFQQGEPAWLVNPSTPFNGEPVNVFQVNAAANQLTLGPTTDVYQGSSGWVTKQPHVSGGIGVGTFILPKALINNYLLTFEAGGSGAYLYIGNSPVMTATYRRIFEMSKSAAGGQPGYFSSGMFCEGDPIDISELFVMGTAGDSYNPSLMVD